MRKYFLNCFSVIIAASILSSCGGGNKSADTSSEESEKVLIKTIRAVSQDVQNTEEFTSNIQAFKENNIAPSLPVRIDQILVDVGTSVRKGQLLVKMDPTQYDQAAVQLANLEADFARMKSVHEAGGISDQQIDQAETQLLTQRHQVANLKDNIELRSPIDGIVTARNYDPGDLYGGAPVLQVMQISTLKVVVNISEQYFPLVTKGMQTDIRVDTYPDRVFEGKVSLIYPAIDANTRTFQVEITIPNSKGELRPGMFSRTTLNFGTIPGIMIDDVAVQKQLGSNDKYIYVVENGKAVRREVKTGIQDGSKINIVSGLKEGEEVIVAGFSKLFNGSDVEVTNN